MANLNLNLNVKCKTSESETEYKAPFMVYHLNFGPVYGKIDELLSYWSNEYPHVLCLMEHHLHEQEISKLYRRPYILAAKYCRNNLKLGRVRIYVHTSLQNCTFLTEVFLF
jgi:hypothetical protein